MSQFFIKKMCFFDYWVFFSVNSTVLCLLNLCDNYKRRIFTKDTWHCLNSMKEYLSSVQTAVGHISLFSD